MMVFGEGKGVELSSSTVYLVTVKKLPDKKKLSCLQPKTSPR